MSAEAEGTPVQSPAPITETQGRKPWRKPFQGFFDNPVILKELRGRMRNRQAFVLLTLYLGLTSIFVGVLYSFFARQASLGWEPSLRQTVGKAIFGSVVLLEFLLLGFVGPGLTSGAVSAERERQTFDLLRTTLLSARSFILGKLGASFTYLFLLILTAAPIQSLAFLLGGVGMGEMIISSLMLVVTAIFLCSLGLFFSSFMKRTLPATLGSYGSILLSILFLILFFFLLAYMETSISDMSDKQELIFSLLAWFLISTNPYLAAIFSEMILVDDQSLFYTKSSFFGTNQLTLPSPWIIYVVFYVVLSLILVNISIRRVNRPDR